MTVRVRSAATVAAVAVAIALVVAAMFALVRARDDRERAEAARGRARSELAHASAAATTTRAAADDARRARRREEKLAKQDTPRAQRVLAAAGPMSAAYADLASATQRAAQALISGDVAAYNAQVTQVNDATARAARAQADFVQAVTALGGVNVGAAPSPTA